MKKKIIIAISSLLLTAGVVAGVIYFKGESKFKGTATGLSGYILAEGVEPGLTSEELQELMQKQVDESKVVFSIYSEPVFKGTKGIIMFANPKYSAHDIGLVVEVDGKTIIKTDKISPNQYIEEIGLMGKALKKGKHRGTALITAYKQDTGQEVGKVAVDLTITSE